MKKNEIRTLYNTTHTKINLKWIKDLNVRLDYRTLANTVWQKSQQYLSPRVMETKINKSDVIKFNSFWTAKDPIKKWKGDPQNGREYLQIFHLRNLYSVYIRNTYCCSLHTTYNTYCMFTDNLLTKLIFYLLTRIANISTLYGRVLAIP